MKKGWRFTLRFFAMLNLAQHPVLGPGKASGVMEKLRLRRWRKNPSADEIPMPNHRDPLIWQK